MGAAAFAEGATTGVSLRLLESQGADADVLEVVGGERLRLVQVEGRTAAGCRLAAVAPFEPVGVGGAPWPQAQRRRQEDPAPRPRPRAAGKYS